MTPELTPLVKRFQRCRWSAARQEIDAMKPSSLLGFPYSDRFYYNLNSSVSRLNEAYQGTKTWKMKVNRQIGRISVWRDK